MKIDFSLRGKLGPKVFKIAWDQKGNLKVINL